MSQRVISRRLAIAAALLGIALATLYPGRDPHASSFALCVVCGELGTLDLLLNVALFVPLGALLAWRGARRAAVPRVVLWSALLSLGIEVLQLRAIPGRDASLADVLANSLGAMLGALAVTVGPGSGDFRNWQRLAWGWVIAGVSVLAFGAWAVHVHVPREMYFVQWEPRRPTYTPFLGSMTSLSVNGLTLHPGDALAPSQFPGPFFDGRIAIAADVVPGMRPNGFALIARLSLATGEFLMIGRQHDALVARYRSNAYRARLRSPLYALENAWGQDPRANRRVEVLIDRGAIELRSLAAASSVVRRHRITTTRIWATLLPFEHAFGRLGLVGDVLWLAVIFAPAAYAGARTSGTWRRIFPVLTIAGVLGLVALFFQPALWWWPYWIVVGVATIAGYWLGRESRRSDHRERGTVAR